MKGIVRDLMQTPVNWRESAGQLGYWQNLQTAMRRFRLEALSQLTVVASACAFLFLATVCAGTAQAQIAFVQANSAGGTSSASQAVTLSGTTAGHLIVVGSKWCENSACSTSGSNVITSVTDSTGDTCAQVPNAAQYNSAGTTLYEDIWYCQDIGGGNETVTVNYTSTVYYHYVFLSEFSGVATTSPVDLGFGYNINPGTNPAYSLSSFYIATPGNTSYTGDLIYSLIYPDANFGTITPGNNALNTGGNDEYQVVGSVRAHMNTWTTSSNAGTSVVMGLAAFKSATGSPSTISNTVIPGVAMDPGTYTPEQATENFENWLGVGDYNGYTIEYDYYAFLCSGTDTNCINNTNQVTYAYPVNRSNQLVISIPLTGCDYTANLSGTVQCTSGHTIPLTGTNSIASGYEDTVFDSVFSAIYAKYGNNPGPIIRLGWEMNLPASTWTWAVGGSGGSTITNGAYAAAFQHVAAIAHGYGLTVEWCPNWGTGGSQGGPAEAFWPGITSVDRVGMDIYDTQNQGYKYYAGDSNPSSSQLYGFYWLEAFADLHNIAFGFDEWGVAGTDSTDAHGADIINGLAALMASEDVTYFNSWQNAAGAHSYPYCDDNNPGVCGSPYGAPLSEEAFCTQFAQTGYTCTK